MSALQSVLLSLHFTSDDWNVHLYTRDSYTKIEVEGEKFDKGQHSRMGDFCFKKLLKIKGIRVSTKILRTSVAIAAFVKDRSLGFTELDDSVLDRTASDCGNEKNSVKT